jgi:hypothetical protein
MTWLTPLVLIGLGFALLAAEVVVFRFSVFILFFIGLACVVTGGFIGVGMFEDTQGNLIGLVLFFSVVFGVTLWGPLKKMQDGGPPPP